VSSTILTDADLWNLFLEAKLVASHAAGFIATGSPEAIRHRAETQLDDLDRQCRRIKELNLLSRCPLGPDVDRECWEYDLAFVLDELAKRTREAWGQAKALTPADSQDYSALNHAVGELNAKVALIDRLGESLFQLLQRIDPANGRVGTAVATTKVTGMNTDGETDHGKISGSALRIPPHAWHVVSCLQIRPPCPRRWKASDQKLSADY
jgi:hypothetical protein